MPGQFQLSVDQAVERAREAERAGVGGLLVFGLPGSKDAAGSGAYDPDGIVQRAFRAIRQNVSDLTLIGDVCLCEYTDHGHCGVVKDGVIENDPSLELLARTALSQVEAGADIVAPSDMMDGRVGAIRRLLDESGHAETPIMSYAAKYASAFYGPFREAADSTPQFGDRRSHQMDPANFREAMREIRLDIEEGADIVMVKPAMPYLDVLAAARRRFGLPIAAYQVSGEFAMIEAAARNGWLDRKAAAMESLVAIRRAGADIIITYYALEFAPAL
jgi:porphobilinogen synthase